MDIEITRLHDVVNSLSTLASVWLDYRSKSATCPACTGRLVLSVSDACTYRATCSSCRWRSSWFVVEDDALRLVGDHRNVFALKDARP